MGANKALVYRILNITEKGSRNASITSGMNVAFKVWIFF